jgi:translation initiation factor eIF-2B subunit delta
MGNAIRWLKLQVSQIDPDVPDFEAKKQLCASIDSFIQERINFADVVITQRAANYIEHNDVVLVYGRNTLVERTLLHAHLVAGKKFEVIVIDDPYEQQGQVLAKTLTAEGLKVSYSGDFGGLRFQVNRANRVFLGAEAMFSNGALYGRSGTSDLAIAARDLGKEVYALCETINITDRVSTDSLTYNEIDPERSSSSSFRLLYDTTLSHYLSTVVTELSSVQATSVSYLLRKLEDSN